jgi:hypothetical protein
MRVLAVCLICACAAAQAQDVALRASVDRQTVRENESFTYILRAAGPIRTDPDFSPMARDFDILQRPSRSTSIQMSGGRTDQVTEWLLQLMPRSPGRLTLPPIELAGAISNPVEIEVLEPLQSDAPADIFLEVDASPSPAYVQAEIILTVRLFRGVSTGRSSLSAPEIDGGEAIVERLGDDREYQVVRNGRSFAALERRYAIFPQSAGYLTIRPLRFEAVVIGATGFSNLQRFSSDAVELEVRGVVRPPPEWPGAVWLPARSVALSERWSADDESLTAGVPQTRTLILEGEGVLESQLPEIDVAPAQGIRQYPDQPELSREVTQQGFRTRRTERYAVIAQEDGQRTLPAVAVPWFDVSAGSWALAELPPRTLEILPSAERPVEAPAAPTPAEPQPAGADASVWQAIAAGLLVAWLATLGLWWQSRRPRHAATRESEPVAPRRAANRRLLRQIKEASAAGDARRARALLLEWGALRIPDRKPSSLGELARHLPAEFAAAVAELERSLYGPGQETWSGRQLEAALADADRVQRPSDAAERDLLLPLYR